ncbi:MAG TPA: hypothetical protein PLV92_24790, partial [Pirellulaceae bacterium]|nr:hypothetical protein [Pirellulaceae bacterium]
MTVGESSNEGPILGRREWLDVVTGAAAVGGAVFGAGIGFPLSAAGAAAPSDELAREITPDWKVPAWIQQVTRMAFVTAGDLERAAKAGVQVVHTNLVWPYFPLRRDGGGLAPRDAESLRSLVERCHSLKMRISLGLPPFPSVEHVRRHPDWRVQPTPDAAATKVEPREDDLGTRIGCNVGPWGDYLVEVCGELVEDFGIDGFSFDGNYHPPICHCGACREAYRRQRDRDLPARPQLDDVAYREYLVWRGEQLERHYARLQRRIKRANPDAAVMTWTVNAGRYG